MEVHGFIAACSIGCAGLSAAFAAGLVGNGVGGGDVRRLAGRAARRCVQLCEQLGHTRLLAHVMRNPLASDMAGMLGAELGRRGLDLSRGGALGMMAVLTALLGLACLVASGSLLGLPVGVGAALLALSFYWQRKERERRRTLVAQMPEVLRSLSASLASGKSLAQAIAHLGRSMGEPMGSEFLRASFEIEGGRSVSEAIDALCGRVDVVGMELLGTALQVSKRTGGSLGDLFMRTSQMAQESARLERELMVKTAQARLSTRIVALMPVVLVGILVVISPDYREGLGTPSGGACLCISALLDGLALLVVRRLMRRSLE